MEHVALYRQFRPKDFDEIVEQKAAVATLRQTVISKRIGHAYLFCGQRGTGKTSIARVFSRAINCESPVNGNPCNKCPTCKGILDGSLMDVIEIDAASNRSIDNIRKICEEVTYAPSKAPYKVYIIDEVHMITTDAFNALLKTLEEPPKHAVFLFATTEPHQIPATILSRCQRFDFRRITTDAIVSRLKYICKEESIKAEDDALTLIASMSDGAMRDAISMLDQAASSASGGTVTAESIEDMTGSVNKEILAKMAEVLIDGKFDDLLVLCKQVSDGGRDLIQFTLDLAGYFRDLLIVRMMPDPTALVPASATTLKRMYEIASKTNSNTLIAFIAGLSKTVSELKWSPSVRTSFEVTLLRMCGRKVKAEEVPLVIPDFAKKQAEAAAKISAGTSSEETKAPETEVKEEPKAEEKPEEKAEEKKEEPKSEEAPKAEKPSPFKHREEIKAEEEKEEKKKIDLSSLPPIARPKEEPEKKEEEKKPEEEKKSEDKSDSDPLASIRARLDSMKSISSVTEDKKEEKPEEPKSESPLFSSLFSSEKEEEKTEEAPAAPAPVDEEPVDPEDLPMENQVDIFNIPAEEPAPAPAAPEEKPNDGNLNIFADLSSSFMDDVDLDKDTNDIYAPTDRIGETKKTRLTAMVDQTPIAVTREAEATADVDAMWNAIIERVSGNDFLLYQLLNQAVLKLEGEKGFIVFSDSDASLIDTIKKEPKFKRVSSDIKQAFSGITKVFLSTERQYRNAINGVSPAPDKEGGSDMSKAEEFMNKLSGAGIETEIHFGDN
ncbi:DNA polymerase III, subunit gamma and tau [Oscillospiraceae bacterium]|nr:DNA polymerase III, subunit gamma and tau [Oscillospiraceae bacterium]